jgi:hypothetical protein
VHTGSSWRAQPAADGSDLAVAEAGAVTAVLLLGPPVDLDRLCAAETQAVLPDGQPSPQTTGVGLEVCVGGGHRTAEVYPHLAEVIQLGGGEVDAVQRAAHARVGGFKHLQPHSAMKPLHSPFH